MFDLSKMRLALLAVFVTVVVVAMTIVFAQRSTQEIGNMRVNGGSISFTIEHDPTLGRNVVISTFDEYIVDSVFLRMSRKELVQLRTLLDKAIRLAPR